MNSTDQVREFHAALGHPIAEVGDYGLRRPLLRLELIAEELMELCEACGYSVGEVMMMARAKMRRSGPLRPNITDAADALADLRYVTEGAAIEWGIPLDAVTDEVHRSNMAKAGGPIRSDGKQLKPPGWTPPDVAGVLARFRK